MQKIVAKTGENCLQKQTTAEVEPKIVNIRQYAPNFQAELKQILADLNLSEKLKVE